MDNPILKALVLTPILGAGPLFATIFFGCGPGKVQTDAAPKKDCNAFAKPADRYYVDDKSYATFNYLWPTDLSAVKVGNWQFRARENFGAAKELYQPACEGGKNVAQSTVQTYFDAVREFFAKHYAEKKADGAEKNILVLIAGMAPAKLKEKDVSDALKALADETVADPKIAGMKKNFALVLQAGHLFNKAAEKVDDNVRYTTPRASSRMTVQDKAEARKQLEKAIKMLKEEVKEEDLNDRQKKFLKGLLEAAEGFLKSLGKQPIPPPIVKTVTKVPIATQ